jgi:hypothetical protein
VNTVHLQEPEIPNELLDKIELERADDDVYKSTTEVVSAVFSMTQIVNDKRAGLYVPQVKVS